MVVPGWGTEGSAKNPPKGKFVGGVLYVAAKAATHKAIRGGIGRTKARRKNRRKVCASRAGFYVGAKAPTPWRSRPEGGLAVKSR